MSRCFVMQPFDGSHFDNRFDDVLAPAIVAAGLEPYRVDRDVGASIPIDEIQTGIRNADVCLADITTDNPNVWFELGFAIACQKEVILVCAEARKSRFPFDVQHRAVVTYRTESPRDFDQLAERVTARLKAANRKATSLAALSASPLPNTEGLAVHEIVALATAMQANLDPENPPSAYSIKEDMRKSGFTDVATAIAVKRLLKIGYLDMTQASNHNRDDYTGFIVTEAGESWLINNQDRLILRTDHPRWKVGEKDDDLPF